MPAAFTRNKHYNDPSAPWKPQSTGPANFSCVIRPGQVPPKQGDRRYHYRGVEPASVLRYRHMIGNEGHLYQGPRQESTEIVRQAAAGPTVGLSPLFRRDTASGTENVAPRFSRRDQVFPSVLQQT